MLRLIDQLVEEASLKLDTLGKLEAVTGTKYRIGVQDGEGLRDSVVLCCAQWCKMQRTPRGK